MQGVPSLKIALIAAVVLHVIILSFLLVEMNFTPAKPRLNMAVTPKGSPKVIQAVSVDESQVQQAVAKLKREQRSQALARQRQIAKMKSEAQKSLRQQQLAKKHLAKLKKQQALAVKQQQKKLALLKKQQANADKQLNKIKQAAKQQQKQQQQEKLKLAKLKQQRQAAAKKLAQQKKSLAKTHQKKAIQSDAEKMLQQQLAQDQAQLTAAKQQQIDREVVRYTALIKQVIGQNWNVPDGTKKNASCILLIRLSPTGTVLNVKLARSSGDAVLDRSAEAAVYKASPLPLPNNKELISMFKEIRLTVRPEGTLA